MVLKTSAPMLRRTIEQLSYMFTVVVRCLPAQISSFECENPTAIELKIEK